MNKIQISKTLIPCLLAGLLLPAVAIAQPGNGPKDGPKRKGPPSGVLKKYDADGDGKLNKAEREAARPEMEARRTEMLKKFDADGDGELSKEERMAAGEAKRAQRHAEILEKYDADGDGTLNKEERAKVREEVGPPPEKRKEMRERAKKRFDADGDGQLSEAEREKARQHLQKRKADQGPKGERKGAPRE